jgi:hypothetical protein
MKKKYPWRLALVLILISASAVVYTIHYLIFRDVHHIFIYLIGDIAFLFLDVLLVIIVIERLLTRQEKKAAVRKLHMLVGAFYSEVGMDLFRKFAPFLENASDLDGRLAINPSWTDREFKKAAEESHGFPYTIKIEEAQIGTLKELRDFLLEKRPFLVRLLENPNLLEHERFTDILLAVFHLAEELGFREREMRDLPKSDRAHLAGDMKRAYSRMTGEWVAYTGYLKNNYPFLFSLAARINPFNAQPSAVVRESVTSGRSEEAP